MGEWMGTPVVLAVVSKCIWNLIFYTAVLLIATGWCVVRVSVPIKQVVIGLIALVIMESSSVVMQLVDSEKWEFVMLVVRIVGLFCYVYIVVRLLKETLQFVIGEGVDPTTNRVHEKFNVIIEFRSFVMVYFALTITIEFLDMFIRNIPILAPIMTSIIDVSFVGAIAVIFRNKNIENEMTRQESENPQLADIEAYCDNEENDRGKPYEEGMELPLTLDVVIGDQGEVIGEPANPYDAADV
jgi:hypothetical protein